MKQVRNIQVLRGVAAVAVVLCHVRHWEGKAVGAHGISPGSFGLGEIGVDLFFVISGFIMTYIQPLALNTPRLYMRFMIHRITRIYPPLWIAMAPLVPLYLWHPELFNSYDHHRVEIIRSFLLLPQDYTPLLIVSWTLIHEIYFYVVVSLALIFRIRGRLIFGIAWFLIVLSVFVLAGKEKFGGNRWLELIFSPFSLTFVLGYFLGLWYGRQSASHPILGMCCIAAGLCGLGMTYRLMPPITVYPDNNVLARLVEYGGPSAMLVLGAILLESSMRMRFASLRHLGDESYAIYLLHLPILAVIYKLVGSHQTTNPLCLAVVATFSVFVCIVAGAIFHRYIELPVTRGARRFLETRLGLIDLRHPESA